MRDNIPLRGGHILALFRFQFNDHQSSMIINDLHGETMIIGGSKKINIMRNNIPLRSAHFLELFWFYFNHHPITQNRRLPKSIVTIPKWREVNKRHAKWYTLEGREFFRNILICFNDHRSSTIINDLYRESIIINYYQIIIFFFSFRFQIYFAIIEKVFSMVGNTQWSFPLRYWFFLFSFFDENAWLGME